MRCVVKWIHIAMLVAAFALIVAVIGGAKGQTGEAELLQQIAYDLRAIADGTRYKDRIC